MFLGEYSPRLDDKGRLTLPAKFRDGLASGVVITKGQDGCLWIWPAAAFADFRAQLAARPVTDKAARDYSRVLYSGASDEIPDKQGRVTVPSALRRYAGLTKDCIVVGNDTRVEIWDAEKWTEYLAAQEPIFAEGSSEGVLPTT
jgi:MraZ protein